MHCPLSLGIGLDTASQWHIIVIGHNQRWCWPETAEGTIDLHLNFGVGSIVIIVIWHHQRWCWPEIGDDTIDLYLKIGDDSIDRCQYKLTRKLCLLCNECSERIYWEISLFVCVKIIAMLSTKPCQGSSNTPHIFRMKTTCSLVLSDSLFFCPSSGEEN